MPILPILYVASLAICFGGGYYYGWAGEYDEVVKLEVTLEQIHQASARMLKEKQQQVEAIKANQETNILELEKRYHDQITTNDTLHDQLVTAQRMHRASNSARDCNVLPKADHTSRSKTDDVGGRPNGTMDTAGFSERFDSFISGKARDADKIDADRRLLLDWVKTIPKDLIQ